MSERIFAFANHFAPAVITPDAKGAARLKREVLRDISGKVVFGKRTRRPASFRLDRMSDAANKINSAGRQLWRTNDRQQVASDAVAAAATRHRVRIIQGACLKEHQAFRGMGVFVHLALFVAAQLGQALDSLPKGGA